MTQALRTLRGTLSAEGDAARASAMQAYMKSSMPFHGVPMPVVRRLARAQFTPRAFESWAALEREVWALWTGARFREERYAALVLLRLPRHRELSSTRALELYERMIVSGAWWDLVDEIATHQLYPLLASAPEKTARVLRRWSRSKDLWLRRAAILAQVPAKAATDVPLLFELIEPAVDEREFFLRKAIGWALRALGPWKPAEVERWLELHAARVSGLSRREALKGLAPERRSITGGRTGSPARRR